MNKKATKRSAGKHRPARWHRPEDTSPHAARPAHREELADTGVTAMRLQSRDQLFNKRRAHPMPDPAYDLPDKPRLNESYSRRE